MRKIIFAGIAIAVVLGSALYLGLTFINPRRGSAIDSVPSSGIVVNDEQISAADLDAAFQDVLAYYRKTAAQSGSDFDQRLQGPSGADQQLELQYQAAQGLIDTALIRQEARKRGLAIPKEQVESAFQKSYESFLHEQGLTDETLRQLFQDPAKKRLTKQLLGISEESVEAFQERLRRTVEDELLQAKLQAAVVGTASAPNADEAPKQFQSWLEGVKAQARIVFADPVLKAYDLEQKISLIKDPGERERDLDGAIAAYEQAKRAGLASNLNLDSRLARLYNLRVQRALEQRDEAQQASGGSSDPAQMRKLADLKDQIARDRAKASQALFSSGFEANNERQYDTLLLLDPENPLYYYLYARFLYEQFLGEKKSMRPLLRAVKLLNQALELKPSYVDAYVLLGDIQLERAIFPNAVELYSQALVLAREQPGSAEPAKTAGQLDNPPPIIERKLAEAYISVARQIAQLPPAEADAKAEERSQAMTKAEQLLEALLPALAEDASAHAMVLADLGDVAVLRSNYATAEDYYLKSLARLDVQTVRAKLGQAYLLNDQLAEAEQAFLTVVKNDPQSVQGHLGLAKTYQAQGKLRQSLEEYKRAFRDGETLSYAERRQIALDAVKVDPSNVEMRLELADFYLQRHVYQGAIEQYQEVLKVVPDSVTAYQGLGEVYLGRVDYDQAEKYFKMALTRNPTPSEQLTLYEQLLGIAQHAVGPGKRLAEDGQGYLYQQARLYLQTGQLEQAQRSLDRLSTDYPEYHSDEVSQLAEQLRRAREQGPPGGK